MVAMVAVSPYSKRTADSSNPDTKMASAEVSVCASQLNKGEDAASSDTKSSTDSAPPVETVLSPPSLTARYTCLSILMGVFAIWGKLTFVDESQIPGAQAKLHHWSLTLGLTTFYLLSLPLLRMFSTRFLDKKINVKVLLRESMVLYNAGQVVLNLWMVCRILHALVMRGHPFISGPFDLIDTGATYAVWVHYCDKYLEFFDTYFMVLRGRMDQVSFLHVYHHFSIAWAWWLGLELHPGGDIYFGALINSWIHVMMYSYYTMSLLKIPCPWKRYLTMAQLIQFVSVVVYSAFSCLWMPEGATWKNYTAIYVQVFEMVSLFVLFMHFYRKTYSKKPAKKLTGEESNSTPVESDTSSDSVPEQSSEQSSVSSHGSSHES